MPEPNEAMEGAKKQILHQKICQSLNSVQSALHLWGELVEFVCVCSGNYGL